MFSCICAVYCDQPSEASPTKLAQSLVRCQKRTSLELFGDWSLSKFRAEKLSRLTGSACSTCSTYSPFFFVVSCIVSLHLSTCQQSAQAMMMVLQLLMWLKKHLVNELKKPGPHPSWMIPAKIASVAWSLSAQLPLLSFFRC